MSTPYLSILRPAQWLKNLMLFFPPFLAGQVLQAGIVTKGLIPFSAFCLVSSSGYIFNDLLDRKRDLLHPQKCLRALPSGTISVTAASRYAIFLLVCGLLLAWMVSVKILVLVVGYVFISVCYSLFCRTIPVLDLFCISTGFLIRLQAGGELFQIPISSWLFLTVFLLALFLSTGKRLSESLTLGTDAGEHRASLAYYPFGFLWGALYMTGAAVLLTYVMYVLNKPKLIYSVPLCLLGLLRYMLRISSGKGGDPTESLLKDWMLFVVGFLWVAMVFWSIYL
jgi:4-hydroxybenzoate polyprenyltransferase